MRNPCGYLNPDERRYVKQGYHHGNLRQALVEAAQLCVDALKDYPQYDNPDDEPSLEAAALAALHEALKPFQTQSQSPDRRGDAPCEGIYLRSE